MRYFIMLLLLLNTTCFANENMDLLLSPQDISDKVAEIARQIDTEYEDKELTLMMVLKGSICITADLMRQLHVPCKLQYIRASSYGMNGIKGGELTIQGLDHLNLEGEHILILDDIFDTGKTMSTIVERIKEKNPASVKSLVLLMKNVNHSTDYRPDYTLFEIENRFVIGYGLDYKELYRGLPGIYAFVNDTPPF